MFNFAHTKMLSGYPAGRTGVSIGVIYILDNLVHEICMGGGGGGGGREMYLSLASNMGPVRGCLTAV